MKHPIGIKAEAIAEEMIANAWSHIQDHCKKRGIKKKDLADLMSKMGVDSFGPTRVVRYDPNCSRPVKTTDLAELCLIAEFLDINVVTLLIGDPKK